MCEWGKNMLRKGISPVIATVILVAVTLVIAVAIVGWLFGLWGGLAGGSPAITISYVKVKTDGTVEAYIRNSGGGSDKLIRVEVYSGSTVIASKTTTITISPNAVTEPTIGLGSLTGVSAGDTVIVKFYFEKSGVQSIQAVVEA